MAGELFVKASRGERPTDPLALSSSGGVMKEAWSGTEVMVPRRVVELEEERRCWRVVRR